MDELEIENKRVIFVTGSLCDGGAERVLSILASECAELGAKVTLIILRNKAIKYNVSPKVNCIQLMENKHFNELNRIFQIRKILKDNTATTVIPFIPIVTLYTLIANFGVGKRIIMSERNDPSISIFSKGMSMKDRIGNFIFRQLGAYKLADWFVFQTREAQGWYMLKTQKNSCIIPNPLNCDEIPMVDFATRKKTVVAVGRFVEQKNFSMLIRGFADFVKSYPEYRLIIYGDGPLKNQYLQLLDDLRIEDEVEFPGFISNLPEKIKQEGMYVSTSNYEGISNSMLEALAIGLPTIVTDCPVGGSRMFVKTDENGILIPTNDVVALTKAMIKIAQNEEYARNISQNAIKIRSQLNSKKIAKKWLELV